MTPFEHLAVLISIIIGLGLTHLLASVHRLAQARARVRLHWLPLMWTVLLFVSQVEWWWASFQWREEVNWNFFYFLFILISPVGLYLASAFVLPDVEPEVPYYDLGEYYFDTRGWFFGVLALNPAVDATRRALQSGSPWNEDALSNAVAAVLVVSLAFSRSVVYHTAVTLVVAALFLAFIVSSALQLA